MAAALTTTSLPLPLVARGKVRDLYDAAEQQDGSSGGGGGALLFVATDRISAFDIILASGIPSKGRLLHALSTFWFDLLTPAILPSHILASSPDAFPTALKAKLDAAALEQLEGRTMLVRKARVVPIEAIVRGYLTGSGWAEYKRAGTVHGIKLADGIQESQEIPNGPIFTPSTKAEQGEHDENIHPDKMVELIGEPLAKAVSDAAIALYSRAAQHAASRGIIIADTKFEFGLVAEPLPTHPAGAAKISSSGSLGSFEGYLILVDEVLTPDSSRFWSAADYAIGRGQASYDKQYVRDWLKSQGLDKLAYDPAKAEEAKNVVLPDDIIKKTEERYREAYRLITGKDFV
ncbi:Bifunctional purine biosynthetic protein ade1 [Tilletia horrida]|nr:Bifunctional purine biosynthetic protein ade1 [Tilletia horrida]